MEDCAEGAFALVVFVDGSEVQPALRPLQQKRSAVASAPACGYCYVPLCVTLTLASKCFGSRVGSLVRLFLMLTSHSTAVGSALPVG